MPSSAYNRLPVVIVYKTYPVYAPDRGPAGYMDRLRKLESEIVFHPEQLHSDGDWAKAGEALFDAPTAFDNSDLAFVNPRFFPAASVPVAADGTYPFRRLRHPEEGGGGNCWKLVCRVSYATDAG